MDIFYIIIDLLYGMAVALGVGSSTLALTFYFLALRDGVIDEAERTHLGVVYTILRIVMVLILILLLVVSFMLYYQGGGNFPSEYIGFAWLLVTVLYGNAALMTLHKMPMWLGPPLQAATWYSLGISTLLLPVSFSSTIYALAYAEFLIVAVIAVETTRRYILGRVEAH